MLIVEPGLLATFLLGFENLLVMLSFVLLVLSVSPASLLVMLVCFGEWTQRLVCLLLLMLLLSYVLLGVGRPTHQSVFANVAEC